MKKNPILVFTGLAVAAVAGVVGLTRDRWMPPAAVEVTTGDASQTAPAAAEQQPAAPAAASAPEAAPTPEQPAATGQAAAPAVDTTAAAEQAVAAEQAAAPADEPPAATEQASAPAAAEQPPKSDAQEAQTPPVEQPPAAESQQAAAPAVEQPAAEQPASEQPAAADGVPTFDTVRVEKTGDAVIAGQAEAGAEVAVKLDGKTIGTTTANSDGSFVVVPEEPLPAGSGALTIETKVTFMQGVVGPLPPVFMPGTGETFAKTP